ncbi:MAG: hypothetical protein K8S87_03250 [Planctomycetes bacterium]|nr:hypothetical protein [Planctomycetota bacterium]
MKNAFLILLLVAAFINMFDSTVLSDEKTRFDPLSQAELDEHLRDSINRKNGEYLVKYEILLDWFDKGSVHQIYKADEENLYLGKSKRVVTVKWSKIKPWVMCELYWLINSCQPGDYWAMASYAYDNQLDVQAGEFLGELFRKWKTLRKKIERYMAKKLGEEVPEKGYEWLDLRPKRCRLVSTKQMKAIKNADKIKKKLKSFEKSVISYSKSKPGKKRDQTFTSLKSIIQLMQKLYADEERIDMLRFLLEGLRESTKRVKQIKDEKSKFRMEQLEKAREEALKRIFDTEKYPNDSKKTPPGGGQRWVSEAVSDVKSIWVNEELGRIETQLEKIATKYLVLFRLIDKSQKFFKEAEFKRHVNKIMMEKIGKAVYDNVADTDETSKEKELRLFIAINYYRVMLGLSALKTDEKLRLAADGHAAHMERVGVAQTRIQGHPFGETFMERLAKVKYKSQNARENVCDKGDVKKILSDFQSNPTKHRNILLPNYKSIGVGIEGNFCCVIIGDK